MARDFVEMEREFLNALKAETGRDLAAWMEAISTAGTMDRNSTIDWLKSHGFQFSRASWLERIHSNGGKPVYIDPPEPRPDPRAQPHSTSPPAATSVRAPAPSAKPAATEQTIPRSLPPRHALDPPARPIPDAAPQSGGTHQAALDALFSSAKGYRPLCILLVSRLRSLVPGIDLAPVDGYVSFRAPGEFATLNVSASELRLGLALADQPFDHMAQKARLKGPGPQLTHMVVLNDARQIGQALDRLILTACQRINGSR